jgi:hypothetical protein
MRIGVLPHGDAGASQQSEATFEYGMKIVLAVDASYTIGAAVTTHCRDDSWLRDHLLVRRSMKKLISVASQLGLPELGPIGGGKVPVS